MVLGPPGAPTLSNRFCTPSANVCHTPNIPPTASTPHPLALRDPPVAARASGAPAPAEKNRLEKAPCVPPRRGPPLPCPLPEEAPPPGAGKGPRRSDLRAPAAQPRPHVGHILLAACCCVDRPDLPLALVQSQRGPHKDLLTEGGKRAGGCEREGGVSPLCAWRLGSGLSGVCGV